MPRYAYRCKACSKVSTIQHLSDERADVCPECTESGTLVKLITTFTTKPSHTERVQPGHVTEEFIQDARYDLKQQKKDLKEDK